MYKSKLLSLMMTLDRDEANAFKKYIRNEVGKDTLAEILVRELLSFHPTFDHPNLQKEFILKKIEKEAKGETYTTHNLNALVNRLIKLLEQFLQLKELKKDKALQQLLMNRHFQRKGNHKFYEKTIAAIKQTIPKSNLDSQTKLFYAFRASYLEYYDPHDSKYTTNTDVQLKELSDQLEEFYLIPRSRINMEMKARERMSPINHEFHNYSAFWNKLLFYKGKNSSLEGHHIALKLYTHNQIEDYKKLIDFLNNHFNEITPSEFMGLLASGINFLIRSNTKKPDPKWFKELLDFYLLGETLEIFEKLKPFPTDQFNNIITCFGIENKIKEGQAFVDKYLNHINPEYQADSKAYSEAALAFYEIQHIPKDIDRPKFRKLFPRLLSVPYSNYSITQRIKDFICRALYLLEEKENFQKEKRNFNNWLANNRNKIPEEIITTTKNSLNQYLILFSIREQQKNKELIDWKKEKEDLIELSPNFSGNWVLIEFEKLKAMNP